MEPPWGLVVLCSSAFTNAKSGEIGDGGFPQVGRAPGRARSLGRGGGDAHERAHVGNLRVGVVCAGQRQLLVPDGTC
eukprot:6192873-Pleurochrysis_carterae.AAC.2